MEQTSQLSFYAHSSVIYNTHRRGMLLLCCGIYFPFCSIMRMRSLSKATQERSKQRLQGSGEKVHVDINGYSRVNWFPLLCLCRTQGCAGDKRRRLSSEFCTIPPLAQPTCHPKRSATKSNESTRKWCKVTGCPHLAAGTAAQTPEAP